MNQNTRLVGIIVVTAIVMIVAFSNTISIGGGAKEGPHVNIGSCLHAKEIDALSCNGSKVTGYIVLPESVRSVSVLKSASGYSIAITGGGRACIRKIALENIYGQVTIRIVENNVPYTIAKLDANTCKWILH